MHYIIKLFPILCTNSIDLSLKKELEECIYQLLFLLFKMDISIFKNIYKEMLIILKDLSQIWLYLATTSKNESRSVFLKLFSKFGKQYESIIDLSTMNVCCSLQESTTIIIQKLMKKLSQFLSDSNSEFCEILCMQIRIGDKNLKKVNCILLLNNNLDIIGMFIRICNSTKINYYIKENNYRYNWNCIIFWI